MANQQIFPQSTYPITGDVQSTPGSPLVQVTGIQSTPVLNQAPQNGQILIFDQPTQQYIPGDPIVSGPNNVGTSASRPPVQIGGLDDGGLVRELFTDTNGGIQLSMIDRKLVTDLLNTSKAILRAIVNLDSTNQDTDYVADQFDGVDPMQ